MYVSMDIDKILEKYNYPTNFHELEDIIESEISNNIMEILLGEKKMSDILEKIYSNININSLSKIVEYNCDYVENINKEINILAQSEDFEQFNLNISKYLQDKNINLIELRESIDKGKFYIFEQNEKYNFTSFSTTT